MDDKEKAVPAGGSKKLLLPRREDEELVELDPHTGKPRSITHSNAGSAKLSMPSQQAGRLTRAYNHVVKLKHARKVKLAEGKDEEEIAAEIRQAVDKAITELIALREMLNEVTPEDDIQRAFKDSWIAKNVTRKEQFLVEAQEALQDGRWDSPEGSTTSSMLREAAAAEEEEARLMAEQEQLQEIQDQRRRKHEEELRLQEQEEANQLKIKLAGVKARKEALDRARSSRASSRGTSEKGAPRVDLPRLPRVSQPTQEWLEAAEVEERPVHDYSGQGEGCGTSNALLQHLLVAQAKLPVFKGDQLEFVWFKRAFEAQVEQVTEDPARKLHLLMQQLEGEPLILVRACQLAPNAAEGFKRAKRLLEDRYGNPVRQSLAFIDKLQTWPTVKTPADLTGFTVQLQLCDEMRKSGQELYELDSAATMLKLIEKLPDKLQMSWQMKVVDIEGTGRSVRFDDLVGFVKRAEKARSHPVFGKLNVDQRSKGTEDPVSKLKVFSTGVDQANTADRGTASAAHSELTACATSAVNSTIDAFKAPCLFCKENHASHRCKRAIDLPKEDRREALRGLCFACLKPGHTARTCRAKLRCETCQGLHPTVMHETRAETQASPSDPAPSAPAARPDPVPSDTAKKTLLTRNDERLTLGTVALKVWVDGGPGCVTLRALLDSASSATFITAKAASSLQAAVSPKRLTVATIRGDQCINTGVVHGLHLAGVQEEEVLSASTVYVVESLPEEPPVTSEDLQQWPHLRAISLPEECNARDIDILVGVDVAGALLPQEVARGGIREPYAIRSALGWAIYGSLQRGRETRKESLLDVSAVPTTVCTKVHTALERLFYTEFEQVYDFSTKGMSVEDREWIKTVEKTAQRSQEDPSRFTIDLPYQPSKLHLLTDNRAQAVQRMQSLRRKFELNPQFKKDYVTFVQKMIDAQHVEEVPVGDQTLATKDGNVVNYVPHHGVNHPKKPNKIRVVFNCASKHRGVSVNDCLLAGPDLTNSLLGVLLRFRQFGVAFMADIEAMFYQVLVPPAQRDSLRFLWWKKGDVTTEPATFRMRVHLFGATSSPSVANFALRRAAQEAFEKGVINRTALETVRSSFYVDDCLKSVSTVEEATQLAKQLIAACKCGGFNLGKFVSTSVPMLQALPPSSLAKEFESIDLHDNKNDPLGSLQERALGVAWSIADDVIYFKVATAEDRAQALTKRVVLSKLSQVYDPLGMAAPVTIVGRILFQELTRNGAGWDEELLPEQRQTWQEWTNSLQDLKSTKLKRCIWPDAASTTNTVDWEMHTFCDSSSEAYAAAVYLRRKDSEGAQTFFVFGKARVTPLKVVTIPRLELTAAKLASDIANLVQTNITIKLKRRVFWSDSKTVLKYLNNKSKRFHVFVANRVHSILSVTEASEWRHVPTNLNSADEASRGIRAEQLSQSSWLNGPEFLRSEEALWPPSMRNMTLDPKDVEVKTTAMTTQIDTVDAPGTENWVEQVAERYSSAHKCRKALAIWLRFKAFLRGDAIRGVLQASELRRAQLEALKWLQRDKWPEEYRRLEAQKTIHRSSSLAKLNPALQEGLLCLQARTRKALPIVPQGSYSRLLIEEAHVMCGHMGRQATAARTRSSFWIIGLNKQVRHTVKGCALCQRNHAPVTSTIMADLPAFRTTPTEGPFVTTGVDYFGPVTLRRGKGCDKAYGIIFTCAITRAVHLEVTDNLSTSSFINALVRFCTRRGNVQSLVSDYGTNFEGANNQMRKEWIKELRQAIHDPKVHTTLREKGIDWKFNCPSASHHGGFWERLIGIIKRCLTSMLGRGAPTMDNFATLLCECEAIMNSRPLTPVSEDAHDLEALTPNHLLLGRANSESGIPASEFSTTAAAVQYRWQTVQQNAQKFWKRWREEYLTLLQTRTKWFTKTTRPLKPNDIVLVAEATSKRSDWKLGKITKVNQSQDGEVRTVELQTAQGCLMRPITKVCLLEAASSDAP